MLEALYNILVLFCGFSAIICTSLAATAIINLIAEVGPKFKDDKLLLAWSLPTGLLFAGITALLVGC